MIFSPPPRNLRAELLDLDEAPYEEVRESLGDVRRVNRYLSGYRVLLHHAGIFLRAHKKSRPVTILDVATGSADQPVALAELARKLGVPVRIHRRKVHGGAVPGIGPMRCFSIAVSGK